MKKLKFLFLPLLFIVTSCYLYKPYTGKAEGVMDEKNSRVSMRPSSLDGKSVGETPRDRQMAAEEEKKRLEKEKQLSEEEQKRIEKDRQNSQIGGDNSLSGVNRGEAKGGVSGATKTRGPGSESKPTQQNEQSTQAMGLKVKIQPNKYYKITAEGHEYKIQADKWEGDTLVSHILRKPNKVLRFHENQIDEELLKERRFSKPYSDLFTVGAYVVGGAAILLLVL